MQRYFAWFVMAFVVSGLIGCTDPMPEDGPTADDSTATTADSDEPTTDFPGVTKESRCAELKSFQYSASSGLATSVGPNGGFLALERGGAPDQTATLHVYDAAAQETATFSGLPNTAEVVMFDVENQVAVLHNRSGNWLGVVRLLDGSIVSEFQQTETRLMLVIAPESGDDRAVWQIEDCSLGYCRTMIEHGRVLIGGLYREGSLNDEYVSFSHAVSAADGTLIGLRNANGAAALGFLDEWRFLHPSVWPDDDNPKTRDLIAGLAVTGNDSALALIKHLGTQDDNHVLSSATLRLLHDYRNDLNDYTDVPLPQASSLSLIGPPSDLRFAVHEFNQATGQLALRFSTDATDWLAADLTQVLSWRASASQPTLIAANWLVAVTSSSDGQRPTDTVTIYDCQP